jgi:predicted nucleic acid-binding Zn ribbon protein
VIIIGTPHTRGSGYTINDKDLASRQEADVQTCPHSQAIIKMQEWAKAPVQNFCMKCMKPTCANPACQDCIPFIQQLERYIATQLRKAQARLTLCPPTGK